LQKRLAHPDEIAGAVAVLAGDGSFATGSIVTVTGGAYLT
jgi:3-oxoacyl-[acyl-carrier protein] reductase